METGMQDSLISQHDRKQKQVTAVPQQKGFQRVGTILLAQEIYPGIKQRGNNGKNVSKRCTAADVARKSKTDTDEEHHANEDFLFGRRLFVDHSVEQDDIQRGHVLQHSRVTGSRIFVRAHEQHTLQEITERTKDLDPVQFDLFPAQEHPGSCECDHTAQRRQTYAVPFHTFCEETAEAPKERRQKYEYRSKFFIVQNSSFCIYQKSASRSPSYATSI